MILLTYTHSHEIKIDSKEWHHKEGFNLGAEAQHKDTLRQVRELLDGIENRWDSPHSRAFPDGSQGNRKYGFNRAIQAMKQALATADIEQR